MDKIMKEILIDEEGDLDIDSDHNSIILKLEEANEGKKVNIRKTTTERTLWNLDDEMGIKALSNNLELNEKIAGEGSISYETFTAILKETAEKTVEKKKVGVSSNRHQKKKWIKRCKKQLEKERKLAGHIGRHGKEKTHQKISSLCGMNIRRKKKRQKNWYMKRE